MVKHGDWDVSRTSNILEFYQICSNYRPQIDWRNIDATIEKCARAAKKHGKNFILIEYYLNMGNFVAEEVT